MSRPWAGPYDKLDMIDTLMLAAMFEPNNVVQIITITTPQPRCHQNKDERPQTW